MAIPDYQFLMLPVLRESARGEVRISAVVEALADELSLSPEDRTALLPSGKQSVFSNRVHWAKSYLSKAGLVELTKRVISKSPRVDKKFWLPTQPPSTTASSISSKSFESSDVEVMKRTKACRNRR